jgi:integrase
MDRPNKRTTPGARRAKGEGGETWRANGTVQLTHTWRDEFDCRQTKTFSGSPKPKKGDKPSWTAEERALKHAEAKKQEFIKKLDSGQVHDREKSLGWIFDYFLGTDQAEGMFVQEGRQTSGTAADNRKLLDRYCSRLRSLNASRLKTAHVDDILLEILHSKEEKKSNTKGRQRTAQLVRGLLAGVIKEAQRKEFFPREAPNPAQYAMSVKYEAPEAKVYNLAQILSLMDTAAGTAPTETELTQMTVTQRKEAIHAAYDRAWIAIAGILGPRESEIAGLHIGAYDPLARSLYIERQRHRESTKSKKGKRLLSSIPAIVAEAIEDVIMLRKYHPHAQDSLFLFPSLRTKGIAISPSTIYNRVMDVIERAKLPKRTFHQLRHSSNKTMQDLKVDPTARAKALGHSKAVNQQTYSHAEDADIVDIMGRIGERLKAETDKAKKEG